MKDLYQQYPNPSQSSAKILFFSGGSALAEFSYALKHFAPNSTHIITTFDSGGCSAQLRRVFNMPAVGDIRNRLLALADDRDSEVAHLKKILGLRFARQANPAQLKQDFFKMAAPQHPVYAMLSTENRILLANYIAYFIDQIPSEFDLRNASFGNICITSGYLQTNKQLQPTINIFSRLLKLRGNILPSLDGYYDLIAEMAGGSVIHGQHNLTGKEVAPLNEKIYNIYLADAASGSITHSFNAAHHILQAIEQADLICFPPGSFYSSIIANLLPSGIGKAVANARCNKVYIPNLSEDPEQIGLRLPDCVATLLNYLRRDCGEQTHSNDLLNFVLLDKDHMLNMSNERLTQVESQGVQLLNYPLISESSIPYYDPIRLAQRLISLATNQ
ncbi:GAK system CofD-like protein [Gayadomonas joobiniege]|uniref:GAK system CofD-like protein n=1 Tax=Gayadomonas joobiniege TaxID=1234606 RepID=UPI000364E234|nr:GAK system CofD-like protein [Gayadomonas joobiniege]